jgi:cobalt-zinc-cadmium efflux system protein
MKKETDTRKNILTAFLLNFGFVIIELLGGIFTNSVAILSDSIHDFGDCIAVGSAYFLERFSHKGPTESYTYGYRRYSIVSAIISSSVLLIGSAVVVYSSVLRLMAPEAPKSGWMIIIAVFGVLINGLAAYRTSHGSNINEHAISLHMLEDVLGWVVVLIGSIVMYIFRGYVFASYVDPAMSLLVTVFIVYNILLNLRDAFRVLLEKAPENFDSAAYKTAIEAVDGVISVHHLHIWSFDGETSVATLHIVVPSDFEMNKISSVKQKICEISQKFGVSHLTVQTDAEGELCADDSCRICEMHEICAHSHHHSS